MWENSYKYDKKFTAVKGNPYPFAHSAVLRKKVRYIREESTE